jgi:catechol 2,3-dioxygenase-like lactoylglutathione lyase family enzyme
MQRRLATQWPTEVSISAADAKAAIPALPGGTMIQGIKFASIPVTDQDRALAFYTEKLGFRLVTDQPFNDEQRWIELGISGADTRVVLFRFDKGLKPGGNMNVTFWTDDVEGTARELKSKGVEFVMEPKREDWGTAAAFQDVDGNCFVLSSRC